MNKYRNKKCEYLGYKFDSIKEMNRYKELLLLEKAGKISDINLQVKFDLTINKIKICDYIADFTYICTMSGYRYVEDCKGFPTPVYKIKKKLVRAILGFEIEEV